MRLPSGFPSPESRMRRLLHWNRYSVPDTEYWKPSDSAGSVHCRDPDFLRYNTDHWSSHSSKQDKRKYHGEEDAELGGTVDSCCLIETVRNTVLEIGTNHHDIPCRHQKIRQKLRYNRIFNMERSRPHDIRRNDTSIEQHGKEYIEHQEFSSRHVFDSQRIGKQCGEQNVNNRSDCGNADADSICSQGFFHRTE